MTRIAGYYDLEWEAALTYEMPADIEWDIEFDQIPTGSRNVRQFTLTGWLDDLIVFERTEFVDFKEKCTQVGHFQSHSALSGVAGMGLKYMDNLAVFAHEHLGLDRLCIRAGDKLGGYRWAFAGFNLAYDRDDREDSAGDIETLHNTLSRRFALIADGLPDDVHDSMEYWGGSFPDHARPGRVREGFEDALWHIAREATLVRDVKDIYPATDASRCYHAAARHFNGAVPAGPYMLAGTVWNGVMHLQDETQRGRLRDAVATKYNPKT